MKHFLIATVVSMSTLVACGDLASAQGFGRGGMGGPQQPQGEQIQVHAVMQTAELLANAVSLTVFDRQRVQMNLREAQRQLYAILSQQGGGRGRGGRGGHGGQHGQGGAERELSQALRTLQETRLILERQAVEALSYVGRALNILIAQPGPFRQDVRQLSRLTLILAEGTVFDGVANTAQNLGYAIENMRHVNPFSKRRMLQAVDQICDIALNNRMNKNEKFRRIQQAIDVIQNQF